MANGPEQGSSASADLGRAVSRSYGSAGRRMLQAMAPVVLAASAGAQQRPTPWPINAMVLAPTLAIGSDPMVAPDGNAVVYAVIDNHRRPAAGAASVQETDVPSWALGSDIWISPVIGSGARNITRGVGSNWGPRWSPDGRRIVFLSDRGHTGTARGVRLWVWERSSDELRQVADLPIIPLQGRLGRLEWTSDSRAVIVKTYSDDVVSPPRPDAEDTSITGRSIRPDTGSRAVVFSFDPEEAAGLPHTNQVNLHELLGDLAAVDIETGAVERLVRRVQLCSYALSPDGRKLVWAEASGYDNVSTYQILADLVVYDMDTRMSRRIVTRARLAPHPFGMLYTWSPTSAAIAFRTNGPVGTRDEVYVVSVDNGEVRRIAHGPGLESMLRQTPPLWDDAGRNVFFVRGGALWRAAAHDSGAASFVGVPGRSIQAIEHGVGRLWSPDGGRYTVVMTQDDRTKRVGFAWIDPGSGVVAQLIEEDKWYDPAIPPAVTPDGKAVVYSAEDGSHPPNLWLLEAQGRPKTRPLTDVASDIAGLHGGVAKIIHWRSLDGDTLFGALIYPVEYEAGRRYPLIVKIYGGRDVSSDVNRFGFASAPVDNLQLFASRGYAVLLADSRLRLGSPMLDLLKTVVPGVDRVIELGIADASRIGVMGHSYGGYSTLGLLVGTRRFKAGVVSAGFGDLFAFYGKLTPDGANSAIPWAEAGQGRMGATPWEAPERYLENSPFFFLDRVQAPLLIGHGGADRAVPPHLADQVFVGLRRLGKRVEYVRYEGETHWQGEWSHRNQIDWLTRTIGWFDRYLKTDTIVPSLGEGVVRRGALVNP